ncbi:MAG: nicotinate (nicotinamide) nucleotide adenylyltransferase [Brevinema sp.]
MNIVIFGGSFDPIHQGHITLIKTMLEQVPLIHRFYIIPTGNHPESKSHLFSNQERLLMLKACFGLLDKEEQDPLLKPEFTHPSLIVSDIELLNKEKSYTIDTLKKLKKIHPNDDFHFLLGADQAENFPQWKDYDQIMDMVHLWVFSRDSAIPDPRYIWNFLKSEEIFISSSMIRESLLKKDWSLLQQYIPQVVRLFLENYVKVK